ncbi:MAG: L,D-transpeptidase family protein [Planctomycetota bacterium]|jgi:lipoprotein-anchoring transpeptidase ErfK/SrfK
MRKALVAFIVLGAGLAIGYTQGIFDEVLGEKNTAEGKTPAAAGTLPTDPAGLFMVGQFDSALLLLSSKADSGAPLSDAELVLVAKCHQERGDGVAEKKAWQEILRQRSGSDVAGEALWGLASLAKRENRPDEALSYCLEALKKYPGTKGGARAALELGDYYASKGDKIAARKAYSAAMLAANPAEKDRIKKVLTEWNKGFPLAGFSEEQAEIYNVQPGDSLARIARRFNTTVGMIKTVNRLEGNIIHPGQELKIIKGDVRLDVVKSSFTLSVYIDGMWVKEYLVGIGKNDKTPEGEFVIANRLENPPWYWKGEVIQPGDPRNILGTRWMGFKNKPGLTGFGIHGTTQPDSVPGAVSRGCLRMRNHEVEELFDMVPLGTRVFIHK